MRNIALELHQLLNEQKRFSFPFQEQEIPKNGIYIIFEKGETYDSLDRIVRVIVEKLQMGRQIRLTYKKSILSYKLRTALGKTPIISL
jgi:hypothetical protein